MQLLSSNKCTAEEYTQGMSEIHMLPQIHMTSQDDTRHLEIAQET